jgi:cleavage and polyadenylation specificity factor subunit 3
VLPNIVLIVVSAVQTVTSSHEALRKRVEAVLDMAITTISSLTESFTSGIPAPGDDVGLSKEKGDILMPGVDEKEAAQRESMDQKVDPV